MTTEIKTASEIETFIQEMTEGYIVCALFTADEELIPPQRGGGEFDPSPHMPRVSPAMRKEARDVCEAFYRANAADLADYPADSAGHDLWYTRNGHGVGFWENDHCNAEQGERLTDAAHKICERSIWRNRGGWFHFDR